MRIPTASRRTTAVATAIAALALTAPAASAAPDDPPRTSHGVFQPYGADADAVTYDRKQVPVGSEGSITSSSHGAHTKVLAKFTGLRPDRNYGAHVHTRPCGKTGAAAGPHFQQDEAPEGVSGDPTYANPGNEIWLDFRTDAAGNAVSGALGDWKPAEGAANSVVIHEHLTRTAPGEAGEAGPRLACLNVRF